MTAVVSDKQGAMARFYRALDTVRMIDSTLPVQTLAAFLAVVLEEGQSINQIGAKIDVSQSSASRNLSTLTDWDWRKKVGLKLVEYRQDPMNLSIKKAYLTPKGKRLAEQIYETLSRP